MVKRYIWMHRKSCLRYCNLDPILHAFFSDNSKTHTYRQRSAVCGVGAESRWRVFLHSWCDAVLRCCFDYCRVGKNRDTRRGSPAGAGAGRTADHLTILFRQKILAVRSANDIYRPVMPSCFFDNDVLF